MFLMSRMLVFIGPVHSISRQFRLITLIPRRYYPASMAKHSLHILELARKGAEHRYEELKTEIETLLKHFPHLSGLASVSDTVDVSAEPAATIDQKLRSRSTMSAAQRAAVSRRMKAYWAERRKAQPKP
jgi:hypothetical protein